MGTSSVLPRSHALGLVEDARTSAVPNVSPATDLTPLVLAKFSKETQMSLKERAALSHPGADKAEVLYLHACHCQELSSVTRCTKKSEVHIVEIVSSHQSSSPKSADHLSALEEDFPFESDRCTQRCLGPPPPAIYDGPRMQVQNCVCVGVRFGGAGGG